MQFYMHGTKARLLIEESQCQILKYEMEKVLLRYSKVTTKKKRKKHHELERKLKLGNS